MIMKQCILSLLLCAVAAQAAVYTFDQAPRGENQAVHPSFCKSLDCPTYTVIKKTSDYEERAYDASNWVSTSATGINYSSANYKMFMKLFDYIGGDNVKEEKIAMTAPVINRIIPGEGPACENNFTMSFFISPKVSNAPSPKDQTVFLQSMPKMTVYVRQFGGFASEDDYIKNAKALADALPAKASYNKEYFYTAGYDAPFQILNRHNEVWFIGM